VEAAMKKSKTLYRWLARRVAEFLKRDDGPTAVEYAVMLMLIVVVCIASITTLGKNTSSSFSYVGSSLQSTY
jgi:pilus assembly protein Flp/PilA